jgi:acetoin utilization deacetylase AcuC-like enzyme
MEENVGEPSSRPDRRGLGRIQATQPSTGTGFVYEDAYLQHDTGPFHPEAAGRLTAITMHLRETNLFSQLVCIKPALASVEWIATIHAREYINEVEQACRAGRTYLYSPDTVISSGSYEAARLAVGGVLAAIDAVMAGNVRNAFCAVRPPGHHALADRAMGFCLFNNVAIGTRYTQSKYGLSKVLIVDWDVHHGNGTQEAFYDDPSVLYFSVHRSPFYPGTGLEREKGAGKGLGFTVNVPLAMGAGDQDYLKAFQEILTPRALAFDPDFVMISAGFDAHREDPLGGMNVTTEGFAEMTRVVKQIAAQYCQGRLVSVLEGGYDLNALSEAVEAHLRVLLE